MQRLPLIINSVDFSAAANRLAYRIYYEERTGSNARMMLNGDSYPDVITSRPVITWDLNALWDTELAALYSAIGSAQFVSVTYWDAKTNAQVTGDFHATISEQRAGLIDSRGTMLTGMILTLRAK